MSAQGILSLIRCDVSAVGILTSLIIKCDVSFDVCVEGILTSWLGMLRV